LWPIYAVAFAEKTISQFFLSANNSIIPSLVDPPLVRGVRVL
jgi:hypothetical protein